MKIIEKKSFDEERTLYGERGLLLRECKFDGEADGESVSQRSDAAFCGGIAFALRL